MISGFLRGAPEKSSFSKLQKEKPGIIIPSRFNCR
jgi:hypothetical protein